MTWVLLLRPTFRSDGLDRRVIGPVSVFRFMSVHGTVGRPCYVRWRRLLIWMLIVIMRIALL